MLRMIFVNLPVADLDRSKAFYEALGFASEPRFTDDTAACMVLSDTIFVMLLTHDKLKSFTTRAIPAKDSSEVMLAISCDSKDEVNRLADAAGTTGGVTDIKMFRGYGALRVVEAWDDDVPEGKVTDFRRAVKAGPDEKIVFSFMEWPSREVCDAAQDKMMQDDSMKMPDDMPFDGKRMIFGGFEPVVTLGA